MISRVAGVYNNIVYFLGDNLPYGYNWPPPYNNYYTFVQPATPSNLLINSNHPQWPIKTQVDIENTSTYNNNQGFITGGSGVHWSTIPGNRGYTAW